MAGHKLHRQQKETMSVLSASSERTYIVSEANRPNQSINHLINRQPATD